MDGWIDRQIHKSMDGPRDGSIDRRSNVRINWRTRMDRSDESIGGSTGRSVDEFSASFPFYFTNCPTPPAPLGSVLHGQHPHNSVYVIYTFHYLSVSTQTTFNLFLFPLHMSIDTPTLIHAHTDLSCISHFPKRKMCSQRLQPLSIFCRLFHLHFHTLPCWYFEQQDLLPGFTLATSS